MGTDGAYYRRFWDGSSWQWEGLAASSSGHPRSFRGDPIAWTSSARAWQRVRSFTGRGQPAPVGCRSTNGTTRRSLRRPPAVVSMAPNRLDVFARGSMARTTPKLAQWELRELGLGAVADGLESTRWHLHDASCRVHLGCRQHQRAGQGTEGGYHVWGSTDETGSWRPLAGVFVGPPAMCPGAQSSRRLRPGHRLRLLPQDSRHRSGLAPLQWLEQHAMPTGFIAGPAMVSTASNRLDIFANNPTARTPFRRRTWDGSAWQPWTAIGGTIH